MAEEDTPHRVGASTVDLVGFCPGTRGEGKRGVPTVNYFGASRRIGASAHHRPCGFAGAPVQRNGEPRGGMGWSRTAVLAALAVAAGAGTGHLVQGAGTRGGLGSRAGARALVRGTPSAVKIVPPSISEPECLFEPCSSPRISEDPTIVGDDAAQFLSKMPQRLAQLTSATIDLLETMVTGYMKGQQTALDNQATIEETLRDTEAGTTKSTSEDVIEENAIDGLVGQMDKIKAQKQEVDAKLQTMQEEVKIYRSEFEQLKISRKKLLEECCSSQNDESAEKLADKLNSGLAKSGGEVEKALETFETVFGEAIDEDRDGAEECLQEFVTPCRSVMSRLKKQPQKLKEIAHNFYKGSKQHMKDVENSFAVLEGLENKLKTLGGEFGSESDLISHAVSSQLNEETGGRSVRAGDVQLKTTRGSVSAEGHKMVEKKVADPHASAVSSLLEIRSRSSAVAGIMQKIGASEDPISRHFDEALRAASQSVKRMLLTPQETDDADATNSAFDSNAQVLDQLLSTTLMGLHCMQTYMLYFQKQSAQTLDITTNMHEAITHVQHKFDSRLAGSLVRVYEAQTAIIAQIEDISRRIKQVRVVAEATDLEKQLGRLQKTMSKFEETCIDNMKEMRDQGSCAEILKEEQERDGTVKIPAVDDVDKWVPADYRRDMKALHKLLNGLQESASTVKTEVRDLDTAREDIASDRVG